MVHRKILAIAFAIAGIVLSSSIVAACHLTPYTTYRVANGPICSEPMTTYDWDVVDFDCCAMGFAVCEECEDYYNQVTSGFGSPVPIACVQSEAKWFTYSAAVGYGGPNGWICKVYWDAGSGGVSGCDGIFEGKYDDDSQRCVGCYGNKETTGYACQSNPFGSCGADAVQTPPSTYACEDACGASAQCDEKLPNTANACTVSDGTRCTSSCTCGCNDVSECGYTTCPNNFASYCNGKCACRTSCTSNNECVSPSCCVGDPTGPGGSSACVNQGPYDNNLRYLCKASSPAQWYICDESSVGTTLDVDEVNYICVIEDGNYKWSSESSVSQTPEPDIVSVFVQFLTDTWSTLFPSS